MLNGCREEKTHQDSSEIKWKIIDGRDFGFGVLDAARQRD